jgi:DNA replication protein DnaD
MEGWISIHRQITEHWLWKSKEPFDKRSAWIDLLLMVNHQKEKIEFDKGFIEVDRGQKITSLEKLATRWNWSRHKVSDFLNRLEQDRMLVQIRDNKKTLISIENYNKYQIKKIDTDMSEDMQKVR